MLRGTTVVVAVTLMLVLTGFAGSSTGGTPSMSSLEFAPDEAESVNETTFRVEVVNDTRAADGYIAFDLRVAATTDVDVSDMDSLGGDGDPVFTVSIAGKEVARTDDTVPLNDTFVTLAVSNATLAEYAGENISLNVSLVEEDVTTDEYIASTERSLAISADAGVTPTPEGGDADESEGDEGADQQAVQLLAETSYDDHGMVTGISPGGNYAAFAMHTGEIVVYDAEADSFSMVHGGVDRQPSHLLLQETGAATVGWIDAHIFGAVDMTQGTGAKWHVEYGGLWDIDASENHSSIAAVTSPYEGPGRVGVATGDGDMLWDQPLDEAAAEEVAITNAGDRVAVGAIEYSTETDTDGTPGIRMYDGKTGDRQWSHETETGAWTVDVHGGQELVAATTDEALIVLDFEGNVVWETDVGGTWVAISDDGSTVVTVEQGKPVAYDAETGEEQWRADDAPGTVYDRLAVSADGDRVVATETVGWTYLVDSGEVVWQEEREDNPANVDISADGATWSVIVQDNERDGMNAYVYRNASLGG